MLFGDPPPNVRVWRMVLHVALAGFFTFGWMRALGTSRAAALVAGAGYMLAPVFVSLFFAGHDGKIFVTALAPLLYWVTERHLSRPTSVSFTAIALVVASAILTSHFQMAYFLFGSVGSVRRLPNRPSVGSGAEPRIGCRPRALPPAGRRMESDPTWGHGDDSVPEPASLEGRWHASAPSSEPQLRGPSS